MQVNNRIPEPKLKRGIKRDHLTQQSIKSFAIPTTSTITENDECVMKKPKIGNTDSDMEISSDDEVQIIEDSNIDDSKIIFPPIVEELFLQKKINEVSNLKCNSSKSFNYQETNNFQRPKIVIASNLLKNNCESFDVTKNALNIDNDSIVKDNVSSTYQDKQNNFNNTYTNSKINVIDEDNNSYCQFKNNTPKHSEEPTNVNVIVDLLENGMDSTKQKELPCNQKQKDLKGPSVEHKLSELQTFEVSLTKNNLYNIFGNDSDDETKIPLIDAKKKSLGVRLGIPSNVNTFKTNKKSNEIIKTKIKTDDPNNKQKKFELSNLVVKLLNPYYVKKIFMTKELFKFMAREIVHKLLESISHPGKYTNIKILFNK